MGQEVNPKLYKFGVSNFWDNVNFPSNKKLVNCINYNYLFNLSMIFFNNYNCQIYYFKVKFKSFLSINILIYKDINLPLGYFKRIKKKKVKLNYLTRFYKCM